MKKLVSGWYNGSIWLWLLWPLSVLFRIISSLRRSFFKLGWLSAGKPDATVIVVGNISVGGNGKTPVVIALAQRLKAEGRRVGILSRGYGSSIKNFPYRVQVTDSANNVGDEPLLMALRTQSVVVIDPNRRRGAASLVNDYNCSVIVCDDGMQHYGLERDVEVVVMDERQLGNQHLLPMGPLREGAWRLNTVNMILHNTNDRPRNLNNVNTPQYHMQLAPSDLVNVAEPSRTVSIDEFSKTHNHYTALAGIGNPSRFFKLLEQHGLQVAEQREFADHYEFTEQDLPSNTVIMTEKDAVKVRAFAHPQCWYLPVSAVLPEQFYSDLMNLINNVPKN